MAEPAPDNRFSDLMNELAPLLSKCVLPIFYLHGESAEHAGTGFLVATPKNDYLISAAHVFNPYKEGKELFFFVGDKKIRKLSGRFRGFADPLDIAVLQLSNEHRPPYPEVDKCSIDIQVLLAGALPRQDKQYLVTGFPASRTEFNWRSKQAVSELRSFLAGSLTVEEYTEAKVNPSEHVLLEFDRKDFFFLDGKQTNFPAPQGLSGSPVWLNHDRVGDNDPTFTPIVAVVIERENQQKQKFIKACDIGFAMALIAEFEAV